MSKRGTTGRLPPAPARVEQKRLSLRGSWPISPAQKGEATPSPSDAFLPPQPSTKGVAIRREMRKLRDAHFGGLAGRAPSPEEVDAGRLLRRREGERGPSRGWWMGPRDPAGRVLDASDRNLLCADVLLSTAAPLVVVGSADHGLAVFDLASGAPLRRLFGRHVGHVEWVTACRFLAGARVVSGGMDGKLCVWEDVRVGGAARCRDLLGHTASVSQLEVNAAGRALSAGYDRTLRAWDCERGRELGCLAGHAAPVLLFDWYDANVLSGDRGGAVRLWDLPTAAAVRSLSLRRGQIGALAYLADKADGGRGGGALALIGDQSGTLTVLDPRQGGPPAYSAVLHPGGVLSGIRPMPGTPYVATCGADRRVLVLDTRTNYSPVHEFTDHTNFIYCLEVFGSLVLSGAGNGWLLVHDALTGECCYGLGANTAAVRVVCASSNLLVAAGDDGKATVYDYD